MSEETVTSREVGTCGVSIDAVGTHASIHLGGTETGKSFEFTMPRGLASHMSSTKALRRCTRFRLDKKIGWLQPTPKPEKPAEAAIR